MFKSIIKLLLILILTLVTFSCSQPAINEAPNIILIMSDDMGYSDLACYGGEINTPNLDRLANNGLRFTQFYNTARCCPTRASLMTGLYPHQAGIGHMTNYPPDSLSNNYGVPEYQGYLNRSSVTIAEVLREAGYHTIMAGKWHLGYFGKEKWPLQRGFDRFYGILSGATNYFNPQPPKGLTLGYEHIDPEGDDYYTTDAFTDYAIRFMEESRKQDERPFFLYLAFNAPHWPLHAPAELINKYRGKYLGGWSRLREERYQRMIKMGLIDKNWKLTTQDSRPWDSLNDEKKQELDFRMAIYAAMIDRMDQNIGRLVEYLENRGILDNTVIIFLDDNGACAESDELGSGPREQLGTKDGYLLSYGRAWANVSNTPFREYKHWVHEGGISSPFIIHWPSGIESKYYGQIVDQYGYLPDIMATCLDLADAEYPEVFNGINITPLEGKSLLPVLKGSREQVHAEPIFWEHEGNKAVRMGRYKLVSMWKPGSEYSWELYDMEADRTETNDLSDVLPEIKEELINTYMEWAERNNILDWNEVNELRNKKR